MQKWKYTVVQSSNDIFTQQKILNDMGKDGWELVSVTLIRDTYGDKQHDDEFTMFLKKPD